MKKVVISILLIAVMVVSAFALVACNTNKDPLVKIIDVRLTEEEYAFAKFFDGWRPERMVKRRGFRYQLLKDREQTFRAFWYTMMLYLREKYGFGITRLERFYALCRARYKEDYDFYLLCTEAGDADCKKRIEATIKEAESLGIEL